VQNKGLTLAVLDPVTDTLQQFGDFSSARAAGNSLCNDVLLGSAVAGAGEFVTSPGPVVSTGGLTVNRAVGAAEANAIRAAGRAVASGSKAMPNTVRVFTSDGWARVKPFFEGENASQPGTYTEVVTFRLRSRPSTVVQESSMFPTYSVDVDELNSVLEGVDFTPFDQFSP
jgi:hypothetical protein